ncbi:hypothetical protein [Coraliomargarita parva]|uniref:hypothetical protein n=1 Tax=Coraliomargarita parva TaxID=3014050 RepID=UPI0022B4B8F5|nr:hypothetical protein [Coraliomargarita parva]
MKILQALILIFLPAFGVLGANASIRVTGEVKREREIKCSPELTLGVALGEANGCDRLACCIFLKTERNGKVEIVCLRIEELRERKEFISVPLKDGDWIHVLARGYMNPQSFPKGWRSTTSISEDAPLKFTGYLEWKAASNGGINSGRSGQL